MSWTDDRVEILKKLWVEGQSASQIAKELGGVTRNCLLYTSPSPRDQRGSRMPSSA